MSKQAHTSMTSGRPCMTHGHPLGTHRSSSRRDRGSPVWWRGEQLKQLGVEVWCSNVRRSGQNDQFSARPRPPCRTGDQFSVRPPRGTGGRRAVHARCEWYVERHQWWWPLPLRMSWASLSPPIFFSPPKGPAGSGTVRGTNARGSFTNFCSMPSLKKKAGKHFSGHG